MPLEIKELHIRVTVNTPDTNTSGRSTAQPNNAPKAPDNEALIAECVEQVLHILQQRQER
jgi:hypothetical protein